MGRGSSKRRRAPFRVCLALAATSAAASGAVADDAPASTAPTIVLTAPSAAPDPVPTAIASALARLILRDERTNPLGLGDWRTAKAEIGAFYADRAFRPIWVDADGTTAAGRAALAQLRRAPEDGLTLGGLALPRDLAGPLEPEALAAAEAAIAAAVVAYAEQASGSRLSPDRLSPVFAADPQIVDPGEALAETAAALDPAARLAAFNPPQKGYRALREALSRVNEATASPPNDLDAAVSDAPAIGDDPLLGLSRTAVRGPGRRGAALAYATRRLTRNAHTRERAAILANMEMWRWEPRDMGERRVEVNIPDYSVTVMDGDSVLMSSRVVVGKPDTPTPVFSDRMRYVLINPTWEVPEFDRQEGDVVAPRSLRPPRIQGDVGRRAGGRAPAARGGQRAWAPRLHVPQRPFRLSARHSGARAFRRGYAGAEPRLRAGRGPGAARRNRAPIGRRRGSRPRSAARSGPSSCRSRCRSTSSISPRSSTRTGRSRSGRTSTA